MILEMSDIVDADALSVDDFIKKSSYLYYSKQALASVADKVISFAKVEGLTAHANSVMARM